MKLYGVTGWKNAGKTGLMERLVEEITARGLSVSTIKHSHHGADVDQPGRDTYRHRQAGAREVILASSARIAIMPERRDQPEPARADLVARLSPSIWCWSKATNPKRIRRLKRFGQRQAKACAQWKTRPSGRWHPIRHSRSVKRFLI